MPKPVDLDELDRYVLAVLQEKGDLSLRKIAKRIEEKFGEEFSITAIRNHLDKLNQLHVIKDIIARIDCSLIGYREMTAFFIAVKPKVPIEKVGRALAKIKNTNAVYQTTGKFSLICLAKCLEKTEQIKLLESIKAVDGIEEINTEVILRRFKEDLTVKIPGIDD